MSRPRFEISQNHRALSGAGFSMDGFWIWCPSVARDDDGRYHMFASRWDAAMSFSPHWLTNSEIVHAVSDTPEGPYRFADVALEARGPQHWDGSMTHNPSIRRGKDGTWLLFYTGTYYEGPRPRPDAPIAPGDLTEIAHTDPRVGDAHRNQRIGLATAPSPFGPWTRQDSPILEPRSTGWDSYMTTNPAPCLLPDGSVLLVYKSVRFLGDRMHLGAAKAPCYAGPYQRLSNSPILQFDTPNHVEDPFVWHANGAFQAIMKDMSGGICGASGGGIHASSTDGVSWQVSSSNPAYSRWIHWDDGSTTQQDFLERPSLLLDDDGTPSHFFAATAAGARNIGAVTRSWNLVIPLSTARPINH